MLIRIYHSGDTYGLVCYQPINGIEEIVLKVPTGTTTERIPGLGAHAFVPVDRLTRLMLTPAQLVEAATRGRLGCSVVSRERQGKRRVG